MDIERDIAVVREFTALYCRLRHKTPNGVLCDECGDVLAYAIARRRDCPQDPKPKCSDCEIHCYREPYRATIREIMRFGAMHCVKHARIDKLVKLALGWGSKQPADMAPQDAQGGASAPPEAAEAKE